MDGWDWTLGEEQYNWLAEVLAASHKTWKFVFLHHLVGGVLEPIWGPYGRGGIEAVRYAVSGRPTFEWGGEDENGAYVFDLKRPGWQHGDIHSLLVEHGVTAVFHGHDHGFAAQELDGVVYQECPVPSDSYYTYGFLSWGAYEHGVRLPNSGHLRVTVSPDDVRIDYVRAFLPGDGANGSVTYSYLISGQGTGTRSPVAAASGGVRVWPSPCGGHIWISSDRGFGPGGTLALFDLSGRLRCSRRLPERSADEPVPWELTEPGGRPLASGLYYLRILPAAPPSADPGLTTGSEIRRLLVLR